MPRRKLLRTKKNYYLFKLAVEGEEPIKAAFRSFAIRSDINGRLLGTPRG